MLVLGILWILCYSLAPFPHNSTVPRVGSHNIVPARFRIVAILEQTHRNPKDENNIYCLPNHKACKFRKKFGKSTTIPQLQVCLFLHARMKILFTGNYDPTYNRTQVILSGLKKRTDVELLERPYANESPSAEDFRWADCVFLPSFTHADVAAVKKKTNKPLIFDPLISKYLTKVYDYKQISPWSPRAYKNFLKDRKPMRAADLLLADTEAHAEYYSRTFKIAKSKIKVLPIGANTGEFFPGNISDSSSFKVGFYGGFIPLQGTDVILRAAKLLEHEEDIKFELLGDGFEFKKMLSLLAQLELKNTELPGWVKSTELNARMNSFDLCLGIFGKSEKSNIVIPNKLFHYGAKRIPFITKHSSAIAEVFTNGLDCITCENDAEDLAQNILRLKNDSKLRFKLAEAVFKLVSEQYNEDKIANRFVEILRNSKLDLVQN
jgi:glycosyltransferase involved in cell wall biosynthesis